MSAQINCRGHLPDLSLDCFELSERDKEEWFSVNLGEQENDAIFSFFGLGPNMSQEVSKMSSAQLPQDNVTSYCKKCKTLLAHTVVEAKAKRTRRVQCKTCGDVHPFRSSAPAEKKNAASVARRKVTISGGESYEVLLSGCNPSDATQYDMSSQFAQRDLISHKRFGIGFVTRVLCDGKIEVLFPDGTRTLVHQQ